MSRVQVRHGRVARGPGSPGGGQIQPRVRQLRVPWCQGEGSMLENVGMLVTAGAAGGWWPGRRW